MRKNVLNFKKITDRRGFMLVDGMVAVLIVAIGLVALAYMYTQGIKTRVAGERRQAAVQIAGQGMEKLKKWFNRIGGFEYGCKEREKKNRI